MSGPRDLGAAALDAAGRGWRVFPLCPGRKRPRAAAAEWEARATTDPDRIERWWARHPADNVGIATGPSGLVVVDLDAPKVGETPPDEWAGATCGFDVLDRLATDAGQAIEPTWVVATPSGGWHLYYRSPAGAGLRNTAGRAGWKIDTRAHGGYVVAAGSIVAGRAYRVIDPTPPVELPAWLAYPLTPPPAPEPRRPVRPPSRRRGYVAAALAGEVQRVLDAGEGNRNQALNAAAWNLGRLVAAGVLPRQVAEDALCEAGVAAGYRDGPRAVAAVVRAALDARLRRGVAS